MQKPNLVIHLGSSRFLYTIGMLALAVIVMPGSKQGSREQEIAGFTDPVNAPVTSGTKTRNGNRNRNLLQHQWSIINPNLIISDLSFPVYLYVLPTAAELLDATFRS